jgi:hypothetical protein
VSDAELLDVAAEAHAGEPEETTAAPNTLPSWEVAATGSTTGAAAEPAVAAAAVAAPAPASGYAQVATPREASGFATLQPGPAGRGPAAPRVVATKQPSRVVRLRSPSGSGGKSGALVRLTGVKKTPLPAPAPAPQAEETKKGVAVIDAAPGYPHFDGGLYPCPQPFVPHQVGGTVITNQALAPHEMLYPHNYRALYPPYYHQVSGGWIVTPFGVQSFDRWRLKGTEVEVKYRSHISLFSGFSKPVIH